MTVQPTTVRPTKAAISVSEMCRLLDLSRSQFYLHVGRGTFHPPLYMVRNRRPFFTAVMAEENLHAKQTGIGVNGQYVLFYEKQSVSESEKPRRSSKSNYAGLIASLQSLGLDNVTQTKVDAAVESCFPGGTDGHDESEVLRAVFRQLKRLESG